MSACSKPETAIFEDLAAEIGLGQIEVLFPIPIHEIGKNPTIWEATLNLAAQVLASAYGEIHATYLPSGRNLETMLMYE